jgi:hypothetical protein
MTFIAARAPFRSHSLQDAGANARFAQHAITRVAFAFLDLTGLGVAPLTTIPSAYVRFISVSL